MLTFKDKYVILYFLEAFGQRRMDIKRSFEGRIVTILWQIGHCPHKSTYYFVLCCLILSRRSFRAFLTQATHATRNNAEEVPQMYVDALWICVKALMPFYRVLLNARRALKSP